MPSDGAFDGFRWLLSADIRFSVCRCISTIFITVATVMNNMYSRGLVTSLWSTPVIILANVAIFVLVPMLAVQASTSGFASE